MSMKSKEREFALSGVKIGKVRALFNQKEIIESYQAVRDSEPIKKYYHDMIKETKTTTDDRIVLEILESKEVQESNEDMIKVILLDKAFNKLVNEGSGEFSSAIIAVITEENLKQAIDEVKSATLETIKEFTGGLIRGFTIDVGIALVEDVEDGEE